MRKLLIAAILLGCNGLTTVDGVGGDCPEPPIETGWDAGTQSPIETASTPPLIEAGEARAVYSWVYHGGPAAPWTFSAFTSPAWEAPAVGGAVDVPELRAGDSIFVLVQALAETAGGDAGLRVVVAENGRSPVAVQGAEIALKHISPMWTTVSLVGIWDVITPGSARVILEGRADPGGKVYIQGSTQIIAIHLRP